MVRQRKPNGSEPLTLPSLGGPAQQGGLGALGTEYLKHSAARGYSPESLKSRRSHLRAFLLWCEERSISQAAQITRPHLERYQRHLHHYRKSNGEPLTFKSQNGLLLSVKMFFRWLTRQNLLLHNPASELELPRPERRLPRGVLTEQEAEIVLCQPQLDTLVGLRDRAILETFYCCGIRRQELVALQRVDVQFGRKVLMVRQGKGRRDRLVPLGRRAAAWIAKYLSEVRPRFARGNEEAALFLTEDGNSLRPHELSKNARRYVEQADIGKKGSCHIWRHTMATLMLERGADIRHIQEILGHADLKATQLYTHLSIGHLQQIHQKTHPAEQGRLPQLLEAWQAESETPQAEPALPSLPQDVEPSTLRQRAPRGSRQASR